MAELIHHIDEIARTKKRHVASVMFDLDFEKDIDSQLKAIEAHREAVANWLDSNGVAYEPCFGFFDGDIDPFYKSDIYVDLEIDFDNLLFCALRDFLENDDETPKIEGVRFVYWRYEQALENEELYKRCLDEI